MTVSFHRKSWPYCPVAEMVPPKKGLQQHGSQKIAQPNLRPPSVNWNVLAGRTQCIAPVGAWVESAQDNGEESPVFATAIQIEKEYKEQQKEKEKTLKHFQQEVKRRVNQCVNLKRKQQLKTSYEAALKESSVIIGFSDSALQLTPKKNTCLYRYTRDSAIGNSNDKVTYIQQADYMPEQFSELAKTVRKTVQQVRHKLASRKAVPEGNEPPEHPGGAHQNPPRRQQAEPCNKTTLSPKEGDMGELPLKGHHDLPAELQEQEVNSDTLKDNNPANTETRAVHLFWPGIEEEQSKKQHQSQYLRYRRLFMDIEREQVKEQQRQKEWQRKMDKYTFKLGKKRSISAVQRNRGYRRHSEQRRKGHRRWRHKKMLTPGEKPVKNCNN
ncbi:coiled-coil domain-containing protein 15 [Pituophis catenifer annectens]|uniref:coiled-coil domain-containing protein 15 n=1 Tax=Pituophis catenifer annectens TaxID=94852 RepID=UPI003995F50A